MGDLKFTVVSLHPESDEYTESIIKCANEVRYRAKQEG